MKECLTDKGFLEIEKKGDYKEEVGIQIDLKVGDKVTLGKKSI